MIEVERRVPESRIRTIYSIPSIFDTPHKTGFFYDGYALATPSRMERMRFGAVYHNGRRVYGFHPFRPIGEYTVKELKDHGEYEETDRRVISGAFNGLKRFIKTRGRHAVIVVGTRKHYPLGNGLLLCSDRIWRLRTQGAEGLGKWLEIERVVQDESEVPEARFQVEKAFSELFGLEPQELIKDPYPVLVIPALSKTDTSTAPQPQR